MKLMFISMEWKGALYLVSGINTKVGGALLLQEQFDPGMAKASNHRNTCAIHVLIY